MVAQETPVRGHVCAAFCGPLALLYVNNYIGRHEALGQTTQSLGTVRAWIYFAFNILFHLN